MEKVYEIYIRTTPERLWHAITDPEIRRKYNFGAAPETDWTPGTHYVMAAPGAPGPLAEGDVLEVDPPRRLVHTMTALWDPDVTAEGASRGDLGDRAGGGLVPTARHPRPAARGCQRPAVRRLADDPLRPQDLARDGSAAHHPRLAHVHRLSVPAH